VIAQHLPALLVVLPLLAAPVCFLLPNNRLPWLFTTLVSWLVLAMAMILLGEVNGNGVLSYAMGGWEPPWGIEYRIDHLNVLLILIVAGMGAVVLPYAGPSVAAEVAKANTAGFYAAYLLALAGLLGITITGDVFNLFVFLEISSLASYILISQARDRRSLVAAYQYLIMGTIGATFLLIGIGLLYSMTGTLNMADLAGRLPAVAQTRTMYTGFAFIVAGAGIKLAMVPLHWWLPNAYTYAPSVVSAFLAATATKVAVYVLMRFMFTVFGVEFSFQSPFFHGALIVLACVAILAGSVVALMQNNVKRLLAYSSIAQIGYMVLGITMITTLGLTAANLHLFNHALMKGALFLALGAMALRFGGTEIAHLRGAGRTMPLTMAAFVVGGLSLIGVPLTAGFISKWYLVLAAIELGWWPLIIVIMAGSLLAVAYIWRIVEVAYFQPPADEVRREAPLWMLVPIWLLVIANIWFGIDTRLPLDLARQAAAVLVGGSP
jgi:multicomponent Na+:H+ antiporter subunit D